MKTKLNKKLRSCKEPRRAFFFCVWFRWSFEKKILQKRFFHQKLYYFRHMYILYTIFFVRVFVDYSNKIFYKNVFFIRSYTISGIYILYTIFFLCFADYSNKIFYKNVFFQQKLYHFRYTRRIYSNGRKTRLTENGIPYLPNRSCVGASLIP